MISRQLSGGASVVALEGDFGVGKTSLAAAAAWDAAQWRANGGPLFIPMKIRLSLRPDDSRESFEQKTMRAVAATLVESAGKLKQEGRTLAGIEAVKRWLQAPEAGGWSGGVSASILGQGGGLSGGRNRTPNTSSGFSESGILDIVDEWLAQLFPDRASGGVICFLDNLEELRDSETALSVMEPLRDALFKRPGLRWLISGAQGMIRAAYASPKMTGVFLDPIEVLPLDHSLVPGVIAARADALKNRDDAVVPVSEKAFAHLYASIGQNLRYALNLSERYAFGQDPEALVLLDDKKRDDKFEESIKVEADRVYSAYAHDLTSADWKVFDKLLREKAGTCSPSDFADFGYKAMPPLLIRIDKLKAAHLVTYTKDDADQRRRTISVSDHGRLAYFRHVNS
ncbi:MarR family winged helix-turn-helix transcriptional regulator [Frondihabitans cladoniiphilus]|uniref:MarR family winged helix-turn-helix transcriptional regulator n=1 Tax=Frondihabitans cladoniiphilus TaxID=715785 RepID=UPI0031E68305